MKFFQQAKIVIYMFIINHVKLSPLSVGLAKLNFDTNVNTFQKTLLNFLD